LAKTLLEHLRLPPPSVHEGAPPGGAWIFVMRRSVSTLPEFWFDPLAYVFELAFARPASTAGSPVMMFPFDAGANCLRRDIVESHSTQLLFIKSLALLYSLYKNTGLAASAADVAFTGAVSAAGTGQAVADGTSENSRALAVVAGQPLEDWRRRGERGDARDDCGVSPVAPALACGTGDFRFAHAGHAAYAARPAAADAGPTAGQPRQAKRAIGNRNLALSHHHGARREQLDSRLEHEPARNRIIPLYA
jgi:hypothetical protein